MRLSSLQPERAREPLDAIRAAVAGRPSLEEAAQGLTSALYAWFAESIVLARVFATVPFGELPSDNQAFVRSMAERKEAGHRLRDPTLVLSLIATAGVKPAWNQRRLSQDHAGIPLLSAEFVGEIPMISRLLSELGLSVEGLTSDDAGIVTRTLGSLSGMFYVGDARSAVDHRRRKVIAAQDFVEGSGVVTVFGFGGAYLLERSIVVLVVFARERVDRLTAQLLGPSLSILKTATMRLVSEGRFFTPV